MIQNNIITYGVGFLLTAILLVFTACEKLFIKPDSDNNAVENFELLWREANEKYTFFEYKNLDWKEVYDRYRPQVREGMTDQELFDVLAAMLYELRDGHVVLIAPFDVARNWSWYLDYPPNFNPNIVERNYLGADYRIIGPFRAQWLTNDIAYIRYSSFASLLAAENLDELARIYGNAKGIIWDIRDNTGGIITNINQIMSRIVNEKTQVGWIRYKQGPGYNDFSEFYPYNIEPAGDYKLNGKIILLTNRKVYSAANFFAAAMLALPQVTLLGDQTGGGGGAPYTGQLLNGWQYTFSTTQLVNLQKEQIENGVPPDIKADMNPAKEAQGIDSIIEQALDILGR